MRSPKRAGCWCSVVNNIWSHLGLPPIGNETALHIDLATAFIALLALAFSIWTWRHQTRLSIEAMRIERDNDLIRWIDAVIDVIVDVEFLLRSWSPSDNSASFLRQRDAQLGKLAAVIDKGRLYFPDFTRDVANVEGDNSPRSNGPPLLDELVHIYDLIKGIELKEDTMKASREDLMLKKRSFVISAQDEVKLDRRMLIAKSLKHKHRGSRK